MEKLPTDISFYLMTYLDYVSLFNLSTCSKYFNRLTTSQTLWKGQFDLYFSVDCVLFTQETDWKKQFLQELQTRKYWKNDSFTHSELSIGSTAVVLSQRMCGKVVGIAESVTSFPKYKIQVYEVNTEAKTYHTTEQTHTFVTPTDKYITLPRHMVETCNRKPQGGAPSAHTRFYLSVRDQIDSSAPGKIMKVIAMWEELPDEQKQQYYDAAKREKEDLKFQNQIWDYCVLFK